MDEESLRMIFDVLDSDSNGILTSNEVQDVFKVFDIKEDEEKINNMVSKADVQNLGGIDFTQFKHIMNKSAVKVDPHPRLLKVFEMIDADSSGGIDGDKLKEYMRKIGHDVTQQEVEEMIHLADENGDGVVSLEEFLKMVE